MSENMDSLLSTKKQGIFIKNKNYKKLSQKFTKIIFCATKIVVNGSKLSKIIFFFERNKNTLCYKNIKKSGAIFSFCHKRMQPTALVSQKTK